MILIVIIEMDDFQRLSIFQKFEKSSIYDDLRVFYKIMEKSRHLESIYGSVLGLLAVWHQVTYLNLCILKSSSVK